MLQYYLELEYFKVDWIENSLLSKLVGDWVINQASEIFQIFKWTLKRCLMCFLILLWTLNIDSDEMIDGHMPGNSIILFM
jgi:hypothetical protein